MQTFAGLAADYLLAIPKQDDLTEYTSSISETKRNSKMSKARLLVIQEGNSLTYMNYVHF